MADKSHGEIVIYYLKQFKNNRDLFNDEETSIGELLDTTKAVDNFTDAYPGIKNQRKMRSSLLEFVENIKALAGNYPDNMAEAKKNFNAAVKNLQTMDAESKVLDALNSKIDNNKRKYASFLEDNEFMNPAPMYRGVKDVEVDYDDMAPLKDLGVKKSAARWIEEAQDRIRKGKYSQVNDIAMIIAARQLANTVPGSKTRLESTALSEGEIKERAHQLMESQPFIDFLNTQMKSGQEVDLDEGAKNQFKASVAKQLTEGHGGQFEIEMSRYMKTRKDVKELDQDLYIRYQRLADFNYSSYDDFINKNKKDFTDGGKKRISPLNDEVAMHAAYMLAAYKLKNEKSVLNVHRLDEVARQINLSPEFRYMNRHYPTSQNLLTTGDFNGFAKKTIDTIYGPHSSENMDILKDFLGENTGELEEGADIDDQQREAANKKLTDEELDARILDMANGKEQDFLINVCIGSGVHAGTTEEIKRKREYKARVKDYDSKYKFLGKAGVPLAESFRELRRTFSDYDYQIDEYKNDVKTNKKLQEPIFSEEEAQDFMEKANVCVNELQALIDKVTNREKDIADAKAQAKRENKKYVPKKLTAEEKKQIDEERINAEHAKKLLPILRKAMGPVNAIINAPEFVDTPKKSAANQKREYFLKKSREFYKAVNKYHDAYIKLNDEVYNKGLAEATKDMREEAERAKKEDALEPPDKYMAKRGRRYRNMYEAGKEYLDAKGTKGEAAAKVKLIDAILDYQTGKEKLMSGDDKIRFDNSMKLLADLTVGTHLEHAFTRQLEHINKRRGAKPGSSAYVTKEMYFDNYSLYTYQVADELCRREKNKVNPDQDEVSRLEAKAEQIRISGGYGIKNNMGNKKVMNAADNANKKVIKK